MGWLPCRGRQRISTEDQGQVGIEDPRGESQEKGRKLVMDAIQDEKVYREKSGTGQQGTPAIM